MKIRSVFIPLAFLLCMVWLPGCQEEAEVLDLNNAVDILDFKIGNRNGIINDTTQAIVVTMPAGTASLSALVPTFTVSSGAVVTPLPGVAQDFSSPVKYTVTSGNVYKTYTVTVRVQEAAILTAAIGSHEGVIDEAGKTITFALPYGTALTELAPAFTLTGEASLSPASGVKQDFTTPVTYTLTSGSVTKQYQVKTVVKVAPDMSKGAIGTKKAFLGTARDRHSIPDDDEQAAADWFFSKYSDADYISWDQVSGGAVNIYQYKVIWWQYDQSAQLPQQALHSDVVALFTSYLKDGGNFYFSGHAVLYFWTIGRIPSEFNMAIGDGGGFENNDTWTIGVNLPGVDHRGHPLYKNILFDQADGFYTFPVIGPGWKEDHNHVMVEVARKYGYPNNSILAYASFVKELDAEWLGVWGGIRDFYMAGVLELKANTTWKGKAIYMGIGGFEWNQNAQGGINPSGVNIYQDNIVQVCSNAIDYLSQN